MSSAVFKHYENFSGVMGAHFNQPEYCDVRVITDDGAEFHCSKYALRCGSEVFHRMFVHDMKEKMSGEVRIAGAASRDIEIALRFMHSGVCELNAECILPVMSIAVRYEVKSLECVCGGYLDNNFCVNAKNCFSILKQIYKFPEISPSIKQQCKDAVLQTFAGQKREKAATEEFLGLSYEVINDILKMAVSHFFLHEQLPLGYINFVEALFEWLDYDKKARDPKATSLLLSLEFEALGIQGITQITSEKAQRTNWASGNPAMCMKIVEAMSSAHKHLKKYTSSETFSCKPGRWSFVCRGKCSEMGRKGITAMATFNFKDTTEVFLRIPNNREPLCGLFVVCQKKCKHFLLLVGEDIQESIDLENEELPHSRNKCCNFWLDAEKKRSLPFDTLAHEGRVLTYVHPLAVETDNFRSPSSEASVSVLARPSILTGEE